MPHLTKLKSYKVQFKLEAVSFAKQNLNRGASRKYGVAVNRIRERSEIIRGS